jgi:polyhydroxybutyrate depolymerase
MSRLTLRRAWLPVLLLVTGAGACATTPPSTAVQDAAARSVSSTTTTAPTETGSLELGPADRPAQLVAPEVAGDAAPLVVLLHGYGASGPMIDGYLGITEQAASRGLYVLLPNGTTDGSGKQFWDATAACCNFTGTPVDDVAYLGGLIDEALAERPIDPDRIYVMGHSNGGFMSYRLACDLADKVTAIAVLAGADAPAAEDCTPSRPVSVLHLHGTADPLITYDGGQITAAFPGALESVTRWAERDGCDATAVNAAPLDLDGSIDGAETAVSTYQGCAEGTAVQLDSIEGGRHSPALIHERVGTDVLDWLLARSR